MDTPGSGDLARERFAGALRATRSSRSPGGSRWGGGHESPFAVFVVPNRSLPLYAFDEPLSVGTHHPTPSVPVVTVWQSSAMSTTSAATDQDRYRQAAQILHDVAKPMRVLSALGWDASIRDEFLAGGAQTLPQPTYTQIDPDPGARRRRRGEAAAPTGQRDRRVARAGSDRDRGDRAHALVTRHAGVPRVQPPALRGPEATAALRPGHPARTGAADPGQPRRAEGRAPDASAGAVQDRRGGRRAARRSPSTNTSATVLRRSSSSTNCRPTPSPRRAGSRSAATPSSRPRMPRSSSTTRRSSTSRPG